MSPEQARCQAAVAAALANPRRPRWTRDEQAQHRADLTAALDGTEWHQPIPNPPRRKAAA